MKVLLLLAILAVLFGVPLYAIFDKERRQSILLGWLLCILVAGGLASVLSRKESVASLVIHTEFEQVGYFKSNGMRGFTFFVTNPNKQDVGAFCQEKKATFPSGRVLKVHFFDDRANTPDVTLKYYFPESSDAALVADYFFNPFNGKQGLIVHKDIPARPKKRGQ